MENIMQNAQNSERKDRNFILFDNGFAELQCKEKNVKKEKKEKKENENENHIRKSNINWFTFYMVLFKNTLNSKHLVPSEELKLRLNIIRQYLPPFYNCQKNNEDSNAKSIIKKFTYHLYSKNNLSKKINEIKNQELLKFDDDDDDDIEEKNKINVEVNQITRRATKTKTQTQSFSKINFHFLNDKKNSKKIFPRSTQKLKTIQENNKKNTNEEKQTLEKKKQI
jgi:hypothetical protein